MPKHGDTRNKRIEKKDDLMTLVMNGKDITFNIPKERTVYESYCAHCKEWIECSDIIDYLVCKKCNASWTEEI